MFGTTWDEGHAILKKLPLIIATAAITGCVQGYVLNSTTGQCVQSGTGTSTPPTNYTWVYILIAIIIAVAIFFGLKGRTASANSRRR